MYENHTIAVIVPAHNERPHVAEVIESIPQFVDRIYAIDDASDDDTWAAIRDAADRLNEEIDPPNPRRVVPIRHERNRGAGGAVITGYRHARADGVDVAAVMDGDGQMDPEDLPRIIRPIVDGEAAYAKGTRLQAREDRDGMSRWRLFGNVLLTMLTRIASGYWEMTDPQNGYTAISRDALESLPLDRLYTDYGFLNDMLVHLNMERERVADVPHRARYGHEVSGIHYHRFIPGLSGLLLRRFVQRVVRMFVVRRFHPAVLCYAGSPPVLLAGVAGVVGALVGVGESTMVGLLLGAIAFGVGLVLLSQGMAYDVETNEGLVETAPLEEPEPLSGPTDGLPVEVAGDGGNLPSSGEED